MTFRSCLCDEVAEWLRRWTANPMCSARVGSNPIVVFRSNRYSGLMIKQDKTEALLLGNKAPTSLELGTTEIIKLLGVHFTLNSLLFYKLNLEIFKGHV